MKTKKIFLTVVIAVITITANAQIKVFPGGDIGIGLIPGVPQKKLHIYSQDNLRCGTGLRFEFNYIHEPNGCSGNSIWDISADGDNLLNISTPLISASPIMTLYGRNNMGIVGINGIPTPALYENPSALKLDVNGHARFRDASGNNYVRLGYNGANAIIDNYGQGGLLINHYTGKNVIIGSESPNIDEYFKTNHNTYLAAIDGNIGIGTTSPSAKLTINTGGSTFQNVSLTSNLNDNSDKGGLITGARKVNSKTNFACIGTWDNDINKDVYIGGGEGFQVADANNIKFYTANSDVMDAGTLKMIINPDGRVGIGTTNFDYGPTTNYFKLAVLGNIHANEIVVTTDWSDYVFEKNYKLKTLAEVENYINEHKHLPDVPSSADVEKSGVNLGKTDAILLQKIEELTLYMIELKKENENLKQRVANIENK